MKPFSKFKPMDEIDFQLYPVVLPPILPPKEPTMSNRTQNLDLVQSKIEEELQGEVPVQIIETLIPILLPIVLNLLQGWLAKCGLNNVVTLPATAYQHATVRRAVREDESIPKEHRKAAIRALNKAIDETPSEERAALIQEMQTEDPTWESMI